MYNIILAAGDGKRFKNYNLPKPLLKVENVPLIIRAANSLPKNNDYIFLCKQEHYDNFKELKVYIKKNFKNSKIILIKKTTKGQASTLLKIENIVKKKEPILVTSTDLCFSFNKSILLKYIKGNLSIIFVCKPTKEMKKYHWQFGWVRSDKNNKIIKISCKKKIRGSAEKDNVILGAFGFPSFNVFLKGYNKMLKKKRLINNEYYIDLLMDELNIDKKVRIIKVKKFINWGTPIEFEKNKKKIL